MLNIFLLEPWFTASDDLFRVFYFVHKWAYLSYIDFALFILLTYIFCPYSCGRMQEK